MDPPRIEHGRRLVHLDTDLGTSVDDLAALAMVLGTPGVKVTGITTCVDPGGRRAGYVRHVLDLAGRSEVTVAAGAEASMTRRLARGDVGRGEIGEGQRRWPEPVAPAPSPAGSALRLLAESVEAGAIVVAIGPFTNLALLGVERPEVLARAAVVVMGGWFDGPGEGLPPWGPARDWNVQCDTTAAEVVVAGAGEVTMVPLSLTRRVHLRRRHLERLRAAGPLGRLLADQAELQCTERSTRELARHHARLPDDLLAFQHDPLTCAAALGWRGIALETRQVAPVYDGEVLHFAEVAEVAEVAHGADGADGRTVTVGTDVDADAFDAMWLAAVDGAARGDPSSTS